MANKQTATKQKINAASILEELKTPAMIILGMMGGAMAGKLMDKAMPVEESTDGKFQVKSLLKPVVQITAGVGGALLLKDKNLKLIACGVTASGIASAVKVFLKKDVLNGLGSLQAANTKQRVFQEPISLSIEPYNPDLPQLPAHVEEVEVEQMSQMSGELDNYEEIKEVEFL